MTCPYTDEGADRLVEAVRQVPGLDAYRLDQPLYADSAQGKLIEYVHAWWASGFARDLILELRTGSIMGEEIAQVPLDPWAPAKPHWSKILNRIFK